MPRICVTLASVAIEPNPAAEDPTESSEHVRPRVCVGEGKARRESVAVEAP